MILIIMKIETMTISGFILLFYTILISARIEFKIDEQPIQIWRVISVSYFNSYVKTEV